MKYRYKLEILEDIDEHGTAGSTRVYAGDLDISERSFWLGTAVLIERIRKEEIALYVCTRNWPMQIDQLVSHVANHGIPDTGFAVVMNLDGTSDCKYSCILSIVDWSVWYALQRPSCDKIENIVQLDVIDCSEDDIDRMLKDVFESAR